MANIVDDRLHVKRLLYNNVDEYLLEIRGERFANYRKEFEAARLEHMRTKHPLQLSLELTSYCNLLCKMCFWNYRSSVPKKNMTFELVENIVCQAKELQIPSIWIGAFTESTLHPEFIPILYKLSEIDPMDFWLTTNGTQLSKDMSEALVNANLTKLSISLDAATPETYKKIRGANYDHVERNIMQLLEIRERMNSRTPFLRVTFAKQTENLHEIEMFQRKWENVVDIIDVQQLFDFTSINKDVNEITETDYKGYDCTDPFYHLVVKHDGQMLPCCLGHYETNDPVYLEDVSIQEYWQSPKLLSFVQTIRDRKYIDCCKRCVSSISI